MRRNLKALNYSNLVKIKWHAFFAGFRIFLPLLFIFYQQNGLNFTKISFLTTAFFIGMLIFEVPSGVFADHFGRKKAIALASLLYAISCLFFGFGTTFVVFLFASFLFGIGEAFISGSDEAIIYDSLKEVKKEKEFSNYYGKKWAYFQYGFVIAALTASFIPNLNIRLSFFGTALFASISFFIALSIVEPRLHLRQKQKHYFEHLKKAIKFVYKHKVIKWLIIYIITITLTIEIFFTYIQFFLKDTGISLQYFGFIYAFFILISGIASSFAHKIEKPLGEKRTLIVIASLLFISIFSLGLIQTIASIFLFITIIEFIFGFIGPVLNQYFHMHVDSHHRATVASLRSFGTGISVVALAPLFGYISDIFTYKNMMFYLASLVIIFSIFSIVRITKMTSIQHQAKP